MCWNRVRRTRCFARETTRKHGRFLGIENSLQSILSLLTYSPCSLRWMVKNTLTFWTTLLFSIFLNCEVHLSESISTLIKKASPCSRWQGTKRTSTGQQSACREWEAVSCSSLAGPHLSHPFPQGSGRFEKQEQRLLESAVVIITRKQCLPDRTGRWERQTQRVCDIT